MKPRERSVRNWTKEFESKSTHDLEALLADIELRAKLTMEPLGRQKAALQKVLKQRLTLVVSNASRELVCDVKEAGLPVTPIISAPEIPIGDVNLLMNTVPLVAAPFDRIIIDLASNLITTTEGLAPTMEVKPMRCGQTKGQRIIAKWTIPRPISIGELFGVELLARAAYEREVSGHKKEGTGWESVVHYYDLQNKAVTGREAIYFGPDSTFDSEATGVIVSRKFTNAAEAKYLAQAHPEDWMTRSIEKTVMSTEIELREGPMDKDKPGLAQDRFLQLIIQLSYLFAKKRLIERRILMTAIYRELNKVGTNPIEREKLYGMKSTLKVIERVLILPLQRPDLATRLRFKPESVLLVGVPGIGKTFLSHYLMTGSYNAIFASIDSDRLRVDLAKSGDSGMSSVFLRIDTINEATSLPVILILDDIDVILEERGDRGIVSKFLNLMQGIRQRGFYILASTNYPEKIDIRLLEPGRLSKIVHVGLPDRNDRAGVIANHLVGLPFASEEEKQEVIETMATATDGWTQRYLWELCAEAARLCGLEIAEHPAGEPVPIATPLTKQHFETAQTELLKGINLKDLRDWDDRIADFVSKTRKKMGF